MGSIRPESVTLTDREAIGKALLQLLKMNSTQKIRIRIRAYGSELTLSDDFINHARSNTRQAGIIAVRLASGSPVYHPSWREDGVYGTEEHEIIELTCEKTNDK